ncbi:signal peptidase I [Candidatus Pacebacteria bacterium]|nr:signal peptidase I [Candidatus Paceibacterota bacterium]
MKRVVTALQIVFVVFAFLVALLFVLPALPFDTNVRLLIVESGSMEPAIPTGSVVLVYPQSTYAEDDVITFASRFGAVPTTHRVTETIAENNRTYFVTKGDANEERDTDLVPMRDVLGSVAMSVPFIGYILDFARQPVGFLFLIVLPALTFIVGEIEKIWRELRKRREGDSATAVVAEEAPAEEVPTATETKSSLALQRSMMDIKTPAKVRQLPTLDLRPLTALKHRSAFGSPQRMSPLTFFISVLAGAALIGGSYVGGTLAYPSDQEHSLDNTLRAAVLDFSLMADTTNFLIEDDSFVGSDAVTFTVLVASSSDSLTYNVQTEYQSGNAQFCSQIDASVSEPFNYDAALTGLTEAAVSITDPVSLTFSLESDAGLSDGDVCMIDVVMSAMHDSTPPEAGYFDEERVTLMFTYSEPVVFAPITIEAFSSALPEVASSTTPVELTVPIVIEDNASSTTVAPAPEPNDLETPENSEPTIESSVNDPATPPPAPESLPVEEDLPTQPQVEEPATVTEEPPSE